MLKVIKDFLKKIYKIYRKNEEICKYLISGALGVFISIFSYEICRILGMSIIRSNIISWIVAVLFMYITNKVFVFKSKKVNKKQLLVEFLSFIIVRVFTLLIETCILYLGSNIIKINDLIIKIVAQIVVIVLNYIFSKLIIFKR